MSDTDVRWRAKKVIQDQSNRLVTDTQIKKWDSKTDPGHTHTKTDITDFPSSMPASDVKAWAKADNKPSYVWNEIGNKPTEFNPSSHKHLKNDITDFPESIKNPLSMSIMLNGGNTEGKDLFTYDGSVAKTVNINYLNIGAAPKEHYHDDRYYTEEETDKTSEYDVSMFTEKTTTEAVESIKKGDTEVVYIGRSTCGYCVKFLPILQQAQKEYGYTTTYIDLTKMTSDDQTTLLTLDNDEKYISENFGYTPMILIFRDGKLVKGWVGYAEYSSFASFLEENGITK